MTKDISRNLKFAPADRSISCSIGFPGRSVPPVAMTKDPARRSARRVRCRDGLLVGSNESVKFRTHLTIGACLPNRARDPS